MTMQEFKQEQLNNINCSMATTVECYLDLIHNGLVAINQYFYMDKNNQYMVEFNCNEELAEYLLKFLGWA